jgi:hypothetical protein
MFEMSGNLERGLLKLGVPPISPPRTDFGSIWARRHDELRSGRDRTQQQLEDNEAEVRRLEQDRKRIVEPDSALWWGIGVLVLFSAVGVIAPLWAMTRTPTDFTPHLKLLFWSFAGTFGLLLIYFVIYASRLTRRKNNW